MSFRNLFVPIIWSLYSISFAQMVPLVADRPNKGIPDGDGSSDLIKEKARHDFQGFQKGELKSVIIKEHDAYLFADFDHATISPPVGKWVLVRDNNKLCAIRFVEFWRSHVDDDNFYYSREEFFSRYDWYYRADGGVTFKGGEFQAGTGVASTKPQIWRIERKIGIKCGSLRFKWIYPNQILFPEKNSEVAFTGWSEISDVNANDNDLVWIDHLPKTGNLSTFPYENHKVPVTQLPAMGGKQLPKK